MATLEVYNLMYGNDVEGSLTPTLEEQPLGIGMGASSMSAAEETVNRLYEVNAGSSFHP